MIALVSGRFRMRPSAVSQSSRITPKRGVFVTTKSRRIPVETQASELAIHCRMKESWTERDVLKYDGWKADVEVTVYGLRKCHILEDAVRLSCGHTVTANVSFISAKTRKRYFIEWRALKGLVRCEYLSESWCVNCARGKAVARGGSLDWLLGT